MRYFSLFELLVYKPAEHIHHSNFLVFAESALKSGR